MSDISVTLPDGSSRVVPAGTTPADIAAAISPGLARAALAAFVDDRLVDLSYPLEADAPRPHRHVVEPGSARALPAQHGAPARGGGDEPVPGHAVRHRPGDRRGLLLRLRRRAAVRAGGPRAHREEDEGAGGAGPALRAADGAARRGAPVLHGEARAAEGPADRREDRRPVRGLLLHDQGSRHVRRLLRRPARAVARAS